jgi:hypothetical protein
LKREDGAHEEGDERNDWERFHADGHGLMYGAAQREFSAAEGVDKDRARNAAGEARQITDVRQSIECGFAN